ncbi:efflux RND transporter periplasmic adaptor subunit [Candidatus Formimonas warabiya]|uniref:Efflux transporter periplasmic adaptor subunit n=1 Tax=Formimonas warabiya TaxID=1761012 RepID=A0A3G1KZ37_FORW1|nr:efflux RND transporter periplasmic adaptor subunit [Candidatus Formimonas warabiya]ATW27776.1 efflux transporter periplasmic adaptor subunit [Candidatus Formimonas warabiya]
MKRVVPLILLALLLFTGCSSGGPASAKQQEPSTQDETSKPVFVMAGKIDAGEKADITTKISGNVANISVDVGSVVKKGDTLVILDTKDYQAQVAQAQAGVTTAEANLTKTKAGARPEQIAQAKAALDSAKINYENAESTYQRNKELFNSGAVSQAQLEASQTQLAAAQAQYASTKDTLDILNKGETKETINVLQSQVKQSQAALEAAKTQLANGTILSPVSGIVSAKNINVGELATPGKVLVSIVNTQSLFINASLPTGLLDKVKVGQKVVVRVSEIPDQEFAGEVSVVNPVIDSGSKNVSVKVKLMDADSLLRPGMFAEIGITN